MIILKKISIALLFGIVGCVGDNKEKTSSNTEENQVIGKIALKDLNHHVINLKEYKGKTIFINFWATWCKPCLQEMPSIQQAQELLKNEDIVFLFATDEAVEQIEKFKTNHQYPFHYVRAENMEALNIMALPTTYIFNAEGKLVFSEMGFRKWDDKDNIDLLMNIIKTK